MGACLDKAEVVRQQAAEAAESIKRKSQALLANPVKGETEGGKKGAGNDGKSKSKKKSKKEKAPEYELGKGCYLILGGESGGSLFMIWSEEPVDGAMAYFIPQKEVPAYKYQERDGKNEIIRGLAGNRKQYFSGWVQFVKTALDNKGILILLDGDKDVDIFYHDENNHVIRVLPNKFVDTIQFKAFAAMPRPNLCFKGVGVMPLNQFADIARKEGGHTWVPMA